MIHRRTVLLAEDEEMHSFPMEVALKRAGFETQVVRNFDDVVACGSTVDALVIDVRLPTEALEGLHAAAELVRRGLPRTVPIIFASVYSEEVDKVRTTLAQLPELSGRYVWLEKWFEPQNLVKVVERRMAESRGGAGQRGSGND